MSDAVAFDTLKFVETLEAGGFTHAQAKAAAEAFAEATRQELATKGDVRETELRLDAKIETAVRDLKIWFGSTMKSGSDRPWSSPSASSSLRSATFLPAILEPENLSLDGWAS